MASVVGAALAAQNGALAGKRAVVVGGTNGIGRGIALNLAAKGADVVVVGRKDRGILDDLEKARAGGAYRFEAADCFLLSEARRCVDALLEDEAPLDLLVQSQGMATIQGFTPSEEGLDQKLCLHVYSRALFLDGLAPRLDRAPAPKTLSVLSAGVHGPYRHWAADPELSKGSYSIKDAADAAGFYNDCILDAMASARPKTTFAHAAPGFVASAWGTEMPTPIRWIVRGLQKMAGRPVDACAEKMVSGLLAAPAGFVLLDQHGKQTPTVARHHDEAREEVAARVRAILHAGRVPPG